MLWCHCTYRVRDYRILLLQRDYLHICSPAKRTFWLVLSWRFGHPFRSCHQGKCLSFLCHRRRYQSLRHSGLEHRLLLSDKWFQAGLCKLIRDGNRMHRGIKNSCVHLYETFKSPRPGSTHICTKPGCVYIAASQRIGHGGYVRWNRLLPNFSFSIHARNVNEWHPHLRIPPADSATMHIHNCCLNFIRCANYIWWGKKMHVEVI